MLTVETEPNDSLATADLFSLPDALDGAIATTGDIDFWKTTLTQGQTLTVRPGATQVPFGVGADDPGQLHYAPSVKLLDSLGNQLGVSSDGRDILLMAPSSGTYHVRVDSGSAFGPFTGGYHIPVEISNYSGKTELEPNNSLASALALDSLDNFRGTISPGSDVDFFSFNGTAGQAVAIKLSSRPITNPTIRMYSPTNTLIASSLAGSGLHFSLTTNGTYKFELRGDNTSGAVSGEYSGQIVVANSPTMEVEPADFFNGAPSWSVTSTQSNAIGTLTSMTDVDVFAVNFTALNQYRFQLNGLTGGVAAQSRVISLYNEFGQILEYGTVGLLSSRDATFESNVRMENTGRHFITVRATSEAGLGSYALTGIVEGTFSLQRDVPLIFQDYTSQVAHYPQFFTQIGPFTRPEVVPYMVGHYEARYDQYDVDVTQTYPGTGVENVGFGIANYLQLGNGSGYGGGTSGIRRPSGDSLMDFEDFNWTSLTGVYGFAGTLSHEVGHGVGLPHHRSPIDFMSYDGQSQLSAVGSSFPFPASDSRIPEVEIQNKRDYLDWTLQAGRMILDAEPNDNSLTAQNSNAALAEMTLEFPAKGAFGAGTNPAFVTKGDLNNDNKQDLIVALAGNGGVNILLGNGDGTFQNPTTLAASNAPWGSKRVTVDDFNGDNKADLAWVNYDTANVSVLLGNGNGTFQSAVNYAAGSFPMALVTGDFNGDNKLDLGVSNGSWHVSVLFGNGNGTFQAPTQYGTAGFPIGIAAVNLTGDNRPELVTSNSNTGNISVFVNNGNGTFQAAVNYASGFSTGSSPWAVAAGDVNGDTFADVVVANAGDNSVSLLLGNGAGTLALAKNYSVPATPYSIAASDLNSDGRADVAVTSYNVNGAVSVLLGQAAGTLSAPIRYAAGSYPAYVVIGDWNGGGQNDLAVANYWSHDVTSLLRGTDSPRNDRVIMAGRLSSATDVDVIAFTAAAGESWSFDIESAEFQYPLDSLLTILNSGGAVVAQNAGGRDGNSGLDSVDPYLTVTFTNAGTYYARVSSQNQSFGNYRLKLTPQRAFDTAGPKVIASWPNGGSTIDSQRVLTFWINDQLDPATLTGANIMVQGSTTGIRSGTASFDPMDSTLVWVADTPLPVDTYTVTLKGSTSGIKDLRGNRLDGETDGILNWPDVSGNGTAGGDFVSTFSINAVDTIAADPWLGLYRPHTYNRGEFTLWLTDELDSRSVQNSVFMVRGTGPDKWFDTADDTFTPADALYDRVWTTNGASLRLYTRGTPDSETYRIEGTVFDSAGNTVVLSEIIQGANQAISADFNRTSDSTFRVDVPNGTYDVTVTLGDPTAYLDDVRVTFDNGVWYSLYVNSTNAGTLTYRVVVNDGQMTTRFQDFGGATSYIAVNSLELVKVGGSSFTARYDFGTTTSPVETGFTKITDSTIYSIGQGYGWQSGVLVSEYKPGIYVADSLAGGSGLAVPIVSGPVVSEMNIIPNSVVTTLPSQLEVTFNGSVNVATLTTLNFRVRYSINNTFFDHDDVILNEADNSIGWDARYHRAIWQPVSTLLNGYYLVELEGDFGGIAGPGGSLLDGEFLNASISGNTTPGLWRNTPSGDGIQGGDYRAMFAVWNKAQKFVPISKHSLGWFGNDWTVRSADSIEENPSDSRLSANLDEFALLGPASDAGGVATLASMSQFRAQSVRSVPSNFGGHVGVWQPINKKIRRNPARPVALGDTSNVFEKGKILPSAVRGPLWNSSQPPNSSIEESADDRSSLLSESSSEDGRAIVDSCFEAWEQLI